MGVNKLYNLYQAGKQISQTAKSPIKQAVEKIKSTFSKKKKPTIGGTKKADKIKEAVGLKKNITKIDDKITKQYEEAKTKVKQNVLDRKAIVGGAKNKRDSKRLMKKADELVKGALKGFKKGGPVDKKKFPDLTGDGKVTFADVLKGRGVINGKKKKKKVI